MHNGRDTNAHSDSTTAASVMSCCAPPSLVSTSTTSSADAFACEATRNIPTTPQGGAAGKGLRWQAQVVTEIVALAAIAPVPVVAFKKLQ